MAIDKDKLSYIPPKDGDEVNNKKLNAPIGARGPLGMSNCICGANSPNPGPHHEGHCPLYSMDVTPSYCQCPANSPIKGSHHAQWCPLYDDDVQTGYLECNKCRHKYVKGPNTFGHWYDDHYTYCDDYGICKLCNTNLLMTDDVHKTFCKFYTKPDEGDNPPEGGTQCKICKEWDGKHLSSCPLKPIRGVGDKICTNMELYEFADSSSRPSNKNRCPSKGKWNNNYLGGWKLSIDDHIKDNQLFALKNVVKERSPINLNMYFDILSSRDADNLIFNFEVINTNTNPNLLTKYTKTGMIYISGYYLDKINISWNKFTCDYRYSNETSNLFQFKETGINISKDKGEEIQRPAAGEYHNIDSWIKEIRLDGRIVYNSNYPVSFTDNKYNNLINLTVKISGNTDPSRRWY